MPEVNESEVPTTSQIQRNRNERTEAKFFEDADKMIAEAERLGTEYQPPNEMASVVNLKAKRDAAIAARTANQSNQAAEEQTRNARENMYKPLNKNVTSLIAYARSAGKAVNEIAALQSKSRDIKGGRAEAINPDDGRRHISVSNLSYVTRAENYAEFIELYNALGIATGEEFYKAATHRAKHAALRDANTSVINAESATNTTGETLDKLTYTDADSLLNACLSAKSYIRSKYGANGQPYKNIAKTRFILPSRLRRK